MNFTKIALLVFLSLPIGHQSITAKLPPQIKGKVIAINDGDTIEILFNGKPLKIRLAHIDCPELKKHQPFGMEAKKFTSALCYGQMVTVINDNKFDRYKRLIGIVINVQGKNINQELLKAGLAWHFKKYSKDETYAALEDKARRKHVGVWTEKNPTPPWDWRRH